MSQSRPHTKWQVAIVLGLIGSAVVTLVVLAFLWPVKTASPHNLPVSVAGPAAAVTAFETAIEDQRPGVFAFIAADDRADAVAQIERRASYGAIVLGSATSMTEVLTAPAGSAVATQMLTAVAGQLQVQLQKAVAAAGGDASAVAVAVTPVVPLSEADPTGAGLAAAAFPLTIGGIIGGVLVSLLVVGPVRRLAALGGFGVASGLFLALVLGTWYQFLPGSLLPNALAIGLAVTATSTFIVGCASLIGRAGIGVGAVVTMFIANPLSAVATPYQFIPEPWGVIGQYMVPGAANWLLRSLSYFPDADTSRQWWVLIAWTAAGVALTIAGHFRSQQSTRVPAASLDTE